MGVTTNTHVDSFIWERDMMWLIHVWDMTHSYVPWLINTWHDSFIRCRTYLYMTWLIHVCGMAHSYVWRVSFMCGTWLIHMWPDSFISGRTYLYMTWLTHVCDMNSSYVWHEKFSQKCVTANLQMCCRCCRVLQVCCRIHQRTAWLIFTEMCHGYGVAPISRLLKMIGLFCKRAV